MHRGSIGPGCEQRRLDVPTVTGPAEGQHGLHAGTLDERRGEIELAGLEGCLERGNEQLRIAAAQQRSACRRRWQAVPQPVERGDTTGHVLDGLTAKLAGGGVGEDAERSRCRVE